MTLAVRQPMPGIYWIGVLVENDISILLFWVA